MNGISHLSLSSNAASTTVNELPQPHHSIAPPTYNQTMGLVDEYEQRQLAFIEHVRNILSQQQQQGGATPSTTLGNPLASISLIPTVGSSSTTTVHRVTSGGGTGRRSHSSRHQRHHHHHLRSSSTNVADVSSQVIFLF